MSILNKLLPIIGILLIMLASVGCSCFGLDTRQPTEPVDTEEEVDSTGDSTSNPDGISSSDIVYTNDQLEDYALDLMAEGVTAVEAVIDGVVETFIVSDWSLYKTKPVLIVEVE